jgi:hypothetical protein
MKTQTGNKTVRVPLQLHPDENDETDDNLIGDLLACPTRAMPMLQPLKGPPGLSARQLLEIDTNGCCGD